MVIVITFKINVMDLFTQSNTCKYFENQNKFKNADEIEEETSALTISLVDPTISYNDEFITQLVNQNLKKQIQKGGLESDEADILQADIASMLTSFVEPKTGVDQPGSACVPHSTENVVDECIHTNPPPACLNSDTNYNIQCLNTEQQHSKSVNEPLSDIPIVTIQKTNKPCFIAPLDSSFAARSHVHELPKILNFIDPVDNNNEHNTFGDEIETVLEEANKQIGKLSVSNKIHKEEIFDMLRDLETNQIDEPTHVVGDIIRPRISPTVENEFAGKSTHRDDSEYGCDTDDDAFNFFIDLLCKEPTPSDNTYVIFKAIRHMSRFVVTKMTNYPHYSVKDKMRITKISTHLIYECGVDRFSKYISEINSDNTRVKRVKTLILALMFVFSMTVPILKPIPPTPPPPPILNPSGKHRGVDCGDEDYGYSKRLKKGEKCEDIPEDVVLVDYGNSDYNPNGNMLNYGIKTNKIGSFNKKLVYSRRNTAYDIGPYINSSTMNMAIHSDGVPHFTHNRPKNTHIRHNINEYN